jgi:hypothetical protein
MNGVIADPLTDGQIQLRRQSTLFLPVDPVRC